MFSVAYKHKQNYRYYPLHEGVFPVVDLDIRANGRGVSLPAIVDTGAESTLVSPQYALDIGLTLDQGRVRTFTTANGSSFTAYGHRVRVTILGEEFEAELFFPEFALRRCLLGRDILERMQVGVNESHSLLYLF